MRRLIYDLLTGNVALMEKLAGGIQGDRAEGVPDTLPFAVLRFEGVSKGVSRVNQTRLTVWVHDQNQDYTLIDEILKDIRALVEGAAPRMLNGVWLNEAEWEGDSIDLYDDVRRTNTRNAAFLLTGSGL